MERELQGTVRRQLLNGRCADAVTPPATLECAYVVCCDLCTEVLTPLLQTRKLETAGMFTNSSVYESYNMYITRILCGKENEQVEHPQERTSDVTKPEAPRCEVVHTVSSCLRPARGTLKDRSGRWWGTVGLAQKSDCPCLTGGKRRLKWQRALSCHPLPFSRASHSVVPTGVQWVAGTSGTCHHA